MLDLPKHVNSSLVNLMILNCYRKIQKQGCKSGKADHMPS